MTMAITRIPCRVCLRGILLSITATMVGCAAGPDAVAISLTDGKAVSVVATDPGTGAVTAAPVLAAQDRYGRLGGASAGVDGLLWVSTVNKDGGQPGPNDDRVVRIQFPAGGGGFD